MYDPLRSKAKVVLYIALAFLMGLGIASGLDWTEVSLARPVVDDRVQVDPDAVRPAKELSDAFVEIARVVTPAVVRIQAVRPARLSRRNQQIPDLYRRFFGPEGPDMEPQPQIAGGSGFLVSKDGYILTNNHVVEGADRITVYLTNRRTFDAQVVGRDPFTDVAVIKIEADEDLPTLSFGKSEDVRVGEWVVAIGNPGFSGGSAPLDYTVTAGIISARGRGLNLINNELRQQYGLSPDGTDLSGYAIEDFLQTDAVINPGNSGGPLVDLEGRAVGINSAIASQTGYYQGYGFAIPIDMARRVMEDLIQYGHVRRPMLGVAIQDVTPEDADAYDLPSVSGAVIQEVNDGSPAEEAGLQAQDVIVAVEGEPVGYSNQLQQRVAEYHPGDRVTVTVYRKGQRRDFEVRLGEAPINELPTEQPEQTAAVEERLGIEVAPLTDSLAQEYGYEEAGGVVITDVQRASPADMQRVVAGLKLLAINDREVTTADDVREALSTVHGGQVVTLHLGLPPDGSPRYVNVRMPGN